MLFSSSTIENALVYFNPPVPFKGGGAFFSLIHFTLPVPLYRRRGFLFFNPFYSSSSPLGAEGLSFLEFILLLQFPFRGGGALFS